MPSNTVGGVSVKVRLDDSDALKQLEGLRGKIAKLNAQLDDKREQKSAIAEQMKEASAAANMAREKVRQLQEALEKAAEKQRAAQESVEITRDLIREQEQIISKGNIKLANDDLSASEWMKTQEAIFNAETKLKEYNSDLKIGENELKALTAEYKEQEKQVSRETTEYEKIVNAVDALQKKLSSAEKEIASGEQDLAKMQEQAANLEKQVVASDSAMAKLEKATATAAGKMEKAFQRVGRMIRRVFVFTIVLRALRELREYLNNVLMSTPEFAEAFAQLKGALLTLVQPIMSVLIPALTRLVQIVTQVVTALAGLVSGVFGKTAEDSAAGAKALYDQANAYKATGSAAKKAANQVAAFDQLDILQDNSSSGSGGSASSAAAAPSFELPDLGEDKLRQILDLVTLIGAGLLGWKVADGFGLGLKEAIGIALILWGTLKIVREYIDAWDNGVDAENLKGLLLGLTALALGLLLVFGAVGAGIGLLLGGIALFILGIKDIIQNGLNLENMLLTIAGLLAAGIGIGLITGSWIPLLILGIAAALLALVYFTGHGGELVQGLSDIFQGFAIFIRGLFSQDVEMAFEGLNQMGLGLEETYLAIIDSIEDGFLGFFTFLNKVTGGVFSPLIDYWKNEFEDTVTFWKDSLNGFMLFWEGVFTLDWEKAWNGLKIIAISYINRMITMIENAANFVIDFLNKIKIGGEPIFELNRIRLPRIEDANGNVITGGERGSGGRTNEGAFRGKQSESLQEDTGEIAETTDSIFTELSGILGELKSQSENRRLPQPQNKSTVWGGVAASASGASLGVEKLYEKIQSVTLNENWGREIASLAEGAVLPISQEFSAKGDSIQQTIAAENGKTAETITQMGNLILAAIQNQELAAYLDGKLVSSALYSPMQVVAKNRGAALVGG